MQYRIIIYIVVIIVLVWALIKVGRKIISSLGSQAYFDSVNELGNVEKKNGVKPTHSSLEFQNYAQKIYDAYGYFNDDEDAIAAVMSQMKNSLDVAELIKAYGTRDNYTMSQFLYSILTTSEIEEYVNKPLRGNGVKTQF